MLVGDFFLSKRFTSSCSLIVCFDAPRGQFSNFALDSLFMTLSFASNLRVVLVAPRNPLNIGASARAMSNFGFDLLRVVNPYEVAFRDAKSAIGASPVLAATQEFSTVAEAIADCSVAVGTTAIRHRQLQQPVKVLAKAALSIRAKLNSSPVALLFGSEKW